MPTVLDLASEMTLQIPGLPRLLAVKQVNQSIEKLQKEYLWSWNIGEGVLIIPDSVGSGTVAVTKYSDTITFDATAVAALNASPVSIIPIIKRQFRRPNGPVYNILSYNSTTGVTVLDRIYTEDTSASTDYIVYRVYYEPPATDGVTSNTDFLRYLSILNTNQGYSITGRRLYMTQQELNARDPLRGAFGQPYFMSSYKPTPNNPASANAVNQGFMQYEMWPHCISNQALKAIYERQHVDLVASAYVPSQMNLQLLKYKQLELGYRFALQNSARIPELKGVDWRFLLAEVEKMYRYELVGAKRNDKEIMLTLITPGNPINNFLGPIDANFMQSHDAPFWG